METENLKPNRYPTVFVHGLFGWGERDELYRFVPYWGLTNGDMMSFLRRQGWDCRAASVGPLSSAWDRACELYAQLTGSRVDYGEAHSKKYGHSRYGAEFDTPLIPGWSAENKVNFVAHSFGGATVRLFMDILANGRPEEISAADEAGSAPSPFFAGGHGNMVHSLSALAVPHNGSTLTESSGSLSAAVIGLCVAAAKALGIIDYNGVFDFKLEQFGIYRCRDESLSDYVTRMLGARFMSTGDHALHDLSVDNSLALNKTLSVFPDVFYFSYPTCRSHEGFASYRHLPDRGMTPILKHYSSSIGKWYGGTTAGGYPIGREWLPNDGLVNTFSAMYPFGERFTVFSGESPSPGTWNVMPVTRLDHFAVMGGIFNASPADVKGLYLDIMKNIDKTY
jgi:triacylglycerol esterase/lipase EstA (alpha/beta hydrolase family)